jgi:hypothetical protein
MNLTFLTASPAICELQARYHPDVACTLFYIGSCMYLPLYVEQQDVAMAQDLIAQFGKTAGIEAAERAEMSRGVGNHLSFCRWRQIERLIIMLSLETALGTIH